MSAPVILVVGGGFRGLSLVERLVANAAGAGEGGRMRVVVADPHDPGPGRIWRTDQPSSLLMNTPASSSTVWVGAEVSRDGPCSDGPDFFEWIARVRAALGGSPEPQDVRVPVPGTELQRALAADQVLADAVRHAAPDAVMPRALHGHYLAWAWREIVARAPAGLVVEHLRAQVADAHRTADGWTVETSAGTIAADAVALCTGWPEGPASPARSGPDSAIDLDHDRIGAGEEVLVRGLGLGFFDSVTLLTQGRGGAFRSGADGRLVYTHSGAEPLVIATSRSGMPYRARASLPVAAEHPHLRRAIAEGGAAPDFDGVLAPAIRRDTALAYYRTLARHEPETLRLGLDEIEAAIAETDPFGPQWRAFAARARHDGTVFSLEAEAGLVAPRGGWRDAAAFQEAVRVRLEDDIHQSWLGARSAVKVAVHTYGAARRLLVPLAAFDGLGAEGARAHARYLSLAFALTNGPPPVRIRELLALVEAGVVRFLGPSPRVHAFPHEFLVRSDAVPGSECSVRHLLDARAGEPGVDADPLAARLLASGAVRRFTRRRGDGAPEPTASVDTDPASGRAIDADGRVADDLVITGLLTLEARLHSLQAPAPRTDAPAFREQDAAARALLAGLRARAVAATAAAPSRG